MASTWETRDLPVLRAAVQLGDRTRRPVMTGEIAKATGLDDGNVQAALVALANEHPKFFDVIDGSDLRGRHIAGVSDCTGHARRAVGAWPTPENLADRVVVALQDDAENAVSEEERNRARKLLDTLTDVGKGVLTGVLLKVFTESL